MREYLLLIVGLLYCAAGSILTYVSVLLVTRKVNDYHLINDQRLPDIVLNFLPEYVFLFEVNLLLLFHSVDGCCCCSLPKVPSLYF